MAANSSQTACDVRNSKFCPDVSTGMRDAAKSYIFRVRSLFRQRRKAKTKKKTIEVQLRKTMAVQRTDVATVIAGHRNAVHKGTVVTITQLLLDDSCCLNACLLVNSIHFKVRY